MTQPDPVTARIIKERRPIKRFLYLLIAPISGWKGLKNARYSPDYYARSVFYPLLALMAAACFAQRFHVPGSTTSSLLQQAVSEFVACFAGYFAVPVLARLLLPLNARIKADSPFGKVYIMSALSALSLAVTLYSLFPNLGALLMVAPIYVSYIIVKGVRFLRVPAEDTLPTSVVMVVLIVGIPVLIYMLLKFMMPEASANIM